MQKGNLKQHMKKFHSGEQTLYNCKVCTFQTIYQHKVKEHVRNVHQKSENINCRECNKSIQKKWLKTHMKMFHSGEQTLYNCKVCIFQSIHKVALSRHVS